MDPHTDPRAKGDDVPDRVVAIVLWRLRADLHRAARAWERIERHHHDPEIREVAAMTRALLFQAVNAGCAVSGPKVKVEPRWLRVWRALTE